MLWNKPKPSQNVDDQRKDNRLHSKTGALLTAGLLASIGAGSGVYWMGESAKDPAPVASTKGEIDAVFLPYAKDDPHRSFVEAVLGSTEEIWSELLANHGKLYSPPTLVLYDVNTSTTCGVLRTGVDGPMYCPPDQKIFINLDSLARQAAISSTVSDFAQAYVIAHEVAHHVQSLSGHLKKIQDADDRGESIAGENGLSVRAELQADCLAGAWARAAQEKFNWLEPGDIEEALTVARALGDDRHGVAPTHYTHGTSEQRVKWFKTGFDRNGECATIDSATL